MICKACANVGDVNRMAYDAGNTALYYKHPENCGCPCMHKTPKQWEKMFNVQRPNQEK